MKVELSQEQYMMLLKMVYLGSWMANSAKDEPEGEYDTIEQYIFSLAKDFGLDKHIAFDTKIKSYFPTEEFESSSGVVDVIDAYNEYTVWEALILSLSKRDLFKQYGADKVEAMTEEEFLEKQYPFIQKYEEEFRDHGFDGLFVEPRK